MNGFSPVLPLRHVGAVGTGVPTARASASQALRGEADTSDAAAATGSFLAMLSAVDATAFDEPGAAGGETATDVSLAGSEEAVNAADPANPAPVAAPDASSQPTPTLPVFNPAVLLAQGTLSAQSMATASAPVAPSAAIAATSATADPTKAGLRSTMADRLSPQGQRSADASVAAIAEPAAPARATASLSAPAPALSSSAVPLAQPSVRVRPLDLSTSSVVPVASPGMLASGALAAASSAGPASFVAVAPVGSETTAIAVPIASPMTVAATAVIAGDAKAAETAVDLAPAALHAAGGSAVEAASDLLPTYAERPDVGLSANSAAQPQVGANAHRSSALSVAEPDRTGLAPDSAMQPELLSAAPRDGATRTTVSLAVAGATELPAKQALLIAPGLPNVAGLQQTTRQGEATQPVDPRLGSMPFGDRIGSNDGSRRDGDGDGIGTLGLFATPAMAAAPGLTPVGPVALGHAAQAAGLHAASVERIVDQVSWWLSQKNGSADFSIDMPGGQPLSVSVQVRGNEAQVIFRSDQPELRQLISQAMPQLKESFGQEGLLLAGTSVSAHAHSNAAGGSAQGGHGSAAQSVPYQPSGRQPGSQGQSAAEPLVAAIARQAPFGTAGRSLDLYV